MWKPYVDWTSDGPIWPGLRAATPFANGATICPLSYTPRLPPLPLPLGSLVYLSAICAKFALFTVASTDSAFLRTESFCVCVAAGGKANRMWGAAYRSPAAWLYVASLPESTLNDLTSVSVNFRRGLFFLIGWPPCS